jgi:hypothetical protein
MTDLSPDEIATLIDYARRKYAEERWPLSPDLVQIRAIIQKLRGQGAPAPEPKKPYVRATILQKKRR